jgi:shikimate dehydrogenase
VRELPGRLVLLGHPLRHSLSPIFQNAALRHAGVPLTYEALDVPPDGLAECVSELRAARAAGNVTIPHKEAFAGLCDRRTDVATRAGAVNTFWMLGNELVGDNTDCAGFNSLVTAVLSRSRTIRTPDGAVVALIGAGGAAAAVCAAVEEWHRAKVRIVNRNPDRARHLASRFSSIAMASASLSDALHGATLVVNATPVGLHGEELPVPIDRLPRDAAVIDLAYRPGLTAWIRAARQAGHAAADGRAMLIVQGAHAFERWLGFAPDIAVMHAALPAA